MYITFCKRVNGKALFTNKPINKGEIVLVLSGEIFDKPSKYSIEIAKNKHIIDDWGSYLNHSFQPNTKIDGKNVVALRNINKDEELHFNYNDNETSMACPFETDEGLVSGKN